MRQTEGHAFGDGCIDAAPTPIKLPEDATHRRGLYRYWRRSGQAEKGNMVVGTTQITQRVSTK
jgi:hypothetical protein